MRKENWFGEVAKSLGDGMFADRVILALAKGKRNGCAIPGEDRQLFKRAADFLNDAITGYQWMDQPSFSSSSTNHANLFGQAVRALSISSVPVNFMKYLEELKDICQHLEAGERVSEAEIHELKEFFLNHSTAEMQHTDRLFATPKQRSGWAWAA
ncbi:MAG: hypothetical protein ABSB82_15520 [Terriglobia bacterium]|jgi:hypothetical protein